MLDQTAAYDGPSGLVALQVVAFALASALAGELLQYLWIYRKPEWKALKANMEKAVAKVESAKAAGGGAEAEKALQKREKELEKWKQEVAKATSVNTVKTTILMTVLMIGSFKLMNSLFANAGTVLRLPFEPPAFIQRVTQRGIPNAGPQDASALFVYVLCQGTLRPLVGKMFSWGPSRAMQEVTLKMPKGWGGTSDKKDN